MVVEFDNQENIETIKKMQRLVEDRVISTQELSFEIDEYNTLHHSLIKARKALADVLDAEYAIKMRPPDESIVEEDVDDVTEEDGGNKKSSFWPWKR